MLYATLENEPKARAYPKARAICPFCDATVIAKCGAINIWHWAHEAKARCDPWAPLETAWHLHWKSLLDPQQVEVVIERDGQKHRADIVTSDGVVVELQHSPLSPSEIVIREAFYGRMVWLFDGTDLGDRLDLRDKARDGNRYQTFRWKWPRKHIAHTHLTTYLDLDSGHVFCIKKMYPSGGGWGHLIKKSAFVSRITRRASIGETTR